MIVSLSFGATVPAVAILLYILLLVSLLFIN